MEVCWVDPPTNALHPSVLWAVSPGMRYCRSGNKPRPLYVMPAQTAPAKSNSNWTVLSRGEVFQKPILSVKAVEVNGVTKYIINEMYWSTIKPADDVAFVCLQHANLSRGAGDKKEEQTVVNVVAYAKGSAAMSLQDKIATITANPEVALALATLLR